SDVRRVGDGLLDALLAAGRLVPDAHRLGVEVAGDGAVVDASGAPSPMLFLVGPLLKARDWESPAGRELRGHGARMAGRLLPYPGPGSAASREPAATARARRSAASAPRPAAAAARESSRRLAPSSQLHIRSKLCPWRLAKSESAS